MRNIYDLVDLEDLNGVVRELDFPDLVLNQWLPNVTVDRRSFKYATNDRAQLPAARYIAFDSPAPIGGRRGLTIREGPLPPLKEKSVLTESEQILADQLADVLPEGIVGSVYADAAERTRSILQRLELAKGEALSRGQVTIETGGVNTPLVFGVPAAQMDVAPAVLWTDHVNAVPLTNMTAWRDIYVAATGQQPGAIVTSQARVSDLALNAQLIGFYGNGRTRITRDEINEVLTSEGLPEITVYDSQYKNPAGAMTRAIAADRFLFLPAPGANDLGQTQFGRTVEADTLRAEGSVEFEDGPAGIAITTMKSDDPPEVWVKAAAIPLPVLTTPELIFSADVA